MKKTKENSLLLLKEKLAELKTLVQEINQSLQDISPSQDNQTTDN